MSIKLIRWNLVVMSGIILALELMHFFFFFIRMERSAYACMADLWLLEGNMTYRIFCYAPILGIIFYSILQKTSGVNWVVRYADSRLLTLQQWKLSFAAMSIIIAVECMGMLLLSLGAGLPMMNWQQGNSMFTYMYQFRLDCTIGKVVFYFILLRVIAGILLWMSLRICWKYKGKLWMWFLIVLVVGELEYRFTILPLIFRSTNFNVDLLQHSGLWFWRGLAVLGMSMAYVWLEKRHIR